MMDKWTVEEALRLALEDWNLRKTVHQSVDGEGVRVDLTQHFEVPSAYAKAILADVMLEEMTHAAK